MPKQFTDEEVSRIRLNLEGWTPREWGWLFRVGTETIRRIIRFETYAEVGENPNIPREPKLVDPMMASARRVAWRAGVEIKRVEVDPMSEEPPLGDLTAADFRLGEEACKHSAADDALAELMRRTDD